MKLDDIRREYQKQGLSRSQLDPDPIAQLESWLEAAHAAQLTDATAMSVATVDPDGQPSQRIVLLKGLDARGLVFYTNLGSRKARDLGQNSKISAHFYWSAFERQVKIRGAAEQIPRAESLRYFVTRPRTSQLAAWASEQSRSLSSRAVLTSAFESMKRKFAAGKVPVPDFWGGYRIVPDTIEFWQGGGDRLHDRFEYTRNAGGWAIERLAP